MRRQTYFFLVSIATLYLGIGLYSVSTVSFSSQFDTRPVIIASVPILSFLLYLLDPNLFGTWPGVCDEEKVRKQLSKEKHRCDYCGSDELTRKSYGIRSNYCSFSCMVVAYRYIWMTLSYGFSFLLLIQKDLVFISLFFGMVSVIALEFHRPSFAHRKLGRDNGT